ncbi:MAG: thioredoxin family protein [Altibacter sp.]|uniref:thioredoxin family protein n=1 Tax=Altibacter sp. TaxID=2024823 RepID=UPI001DA2CD83|nr:thioredoxin family protein [Altibacter sp.]MBZ0328027.1 thioredoxin family protein [Altibacter sp.]
MEKLITEAVKAGMTYAEYNSLFKRLVEAGRTTGESTTEKITYTKLNFSRSKRLDKTFFLTDIQAKQFRSLTQKQTWLVITEPWCGDGAQTLPLLHRIAETSPHIDLKIVLRDDYLDLMDAFLTNGSRSIPKLIILDEHMEVLGDWGPRSNAATQMVTDYKTTHGKIDAAFKEELQRWYNQDRGQAIIKELLALIPVIAKGALKEV